jgi:hypothetical protein
VRSAVIQVADLDCISSWQGRYQSGGVCNICRFGREVVAAARCLDCVRSVVTRVMSHMQHSTRSRRQWIALVMGLLLLRSSFAGMFEVARGGKVVGYGKWSHAGSCTIQHEQRD